MSKRKKLNCRKIAENGFRKNSRDAAQNDAAERSCRRDFADSECEASAKSVTVYVRREQ